MHRSLLHSRWLALAFGACVLLPVRANAAPQSPVGLWVTGRNQGLVQIYACGPHALCGALVGFPMDHPSDPTPQTWNGGSQCRFAFIQGLRLHTRAWHGRITNPQSGHSYAVKIHLLSPDVLALRGFLVLPVLGSTRHWQRYVGPPPPADCRMPPGSLG